MLFAYSQFAVDGGGIGNDPALYLYSVGHLTTAFYILQIQVMPTIKPGTPVPAVSVASDGAKQSNQNKTTATITIPVSNREGIVTVEDLLSEIGRQYKEEMRLKNAAFSFFGRSGAVSGVP